MAEVTKEWLSTCEDMVKVNLVYDDVTLVISKVEIVNNHSEGIAFNIRDEVGAVDNTVVAGAGITTTVIPSTSISLVDTAGVLSTGTNFSMQLG